MECPVCKTSAFVKRGQGSHAEGNNGYYSHVTYTCTKCNGEFSIMTEGKNDEINILEIKYKKCDNNYKGCHTIA